MIYGIYGISILFVFLIGYAIGRRVGIKEGFLKGSTINTLKLKEQLLKKSRCPLCNKLH